MVKKNIGKVSDLSKFSKISHENEILSQRGVGGGGKGSWTEPSLNLPLTAWENVLPFILISSQKYIYIKSMLMNTCVYFLSLPASKARDIGNSRILIVHLSRVLLYFACGNISMKLHSHTKYDVMICHD